MQLSTIESDMAGFTPVFGYVDVYDVVEQLLSPLQNDTQFGVDLKQTSLGCRCYTRNLAIS